MKRTLWKLICAVVATMLTFAGCQRPNDIDRETVSGRQAIELLAEGERYEKEGNFKLALDRYGKARDQSPAPAIFYRMGVCYNALGEYGPAQENLTTAIRMAGDYPEAQYLLSKVRIQSMIATRQGKAPGAVARTTPGMAPATTPGVTPATTAATATPRVPAATLTPTPRATPREIALATPTPAPARTPRATTTPEPKFTALTPPGKATPTPDTRLAAVPTPRPTLTPEPRPAPGAPTRVVVTPRPALETPGATRVVITPAPVRTPALASAGPGIVRTPAPLERTSILPEKTPALAAATPPPLKTPESPRSVIQPTPAPGRTPTAITMEEPSVSPSNPVVMTPPSSVEAIATPRPAPRPTGPASPQTPGSAKPLAPLPLKDIFGPETTQTDLSSTAPATGTKYSGIGTTEGSTLLGQPEFHWEQAKSYLERKMDEEAVAELLLVLGARPRFTDARLELADAYDRLGRGEKALEQYEKARVFAPEQPKPYFRTGNYYLRHGKDNPAYYDRARTYYYEAITRDAKYYFALHNVGVAYMEQANYDEARKWFEKALAVNPNYASAHRNLGLLYDQHLNNPKLAIRHYNEYIRLGGPDTDEVRQWLRALEEAK